MRLSLFSSMWLYSRDIFRSFKSIFYSSLTAAPYLFGVGEGRKEVTEQYPDPVSSKTEDDLPPRSRSFVSNNIDQCTGCGDCALVCPVHCIEIETQKGPDPSKTWVSVFDIDHGRCILCGLCVDVCAPESIQHTKNFEMASYMIEDLVQHQGRGKITPEQMKQWRRQKEMESID